ncbi:MAG: hypothetical protein EXR07_10325 [Acetobacteraceae bacterium]|nr:hypothetical protein [Acetobacteraceae bacterium]
MQAQFFSIPVHADADATAELNQFLTARRILSIDRQFIADGANSAWAPCVTFDNGGAVQRLPASGTRSQKADYRELLTEPEFAVFSRLRAPRKTLSDRDGVPSYAVFSNDQLIQIVKGRIDTTTRLQEIQGIGEARVEKYGEPFLNVLREAALPGLPPAADAT